MTDPLSFASTCTSSIVLCKSAPSPATLESMLSSTIGTLATVDTVCTHTCITDTCITRCTRFVSQVTIIVAGSFERRFTASCVCCLRLAANDRLLAKLSAEDWSPTVALR